MQSLTLLLSLMSLLAQDGSVPTDSRGWINKGVQEYKSARYQDATQSFERAVDLDPNNTVARLYLATSLMSQYIPGAESPYNLEMASRARSEFSRVLEVNPNDTTALASLASLMYQQAQGMTDQEKKFQKLDESASWYEKLIAADPQNKEGFYSLGVIDWLKWYPAYQTARAKLGMKPEEPGPLKDKKAKEELTEKYSGIIEDGLKNLQHALDIDPHYDDAMAYMNLLIRERADLADSEDQYKKDIATADNWVQKALDTKKEKAEKAAKAGATGITQEPAK
jgi:tetratricopeptide (TPR) repeat protein